MLTRAMRVKTVKYTISIEIDRYFLNLIKKATLSDYCTQNPRNCVNIKSIIYFQNIQNIKI